jgi:hypothetical protein
VPDAARLTGRLPGGRGGIIRAVDGPLIDPHRKGAATMTTFARRILASAAITVLVGLAFLGAVRAVTPAAAPAAPPTAAAPADLTAAGAPADPTAGLPVDLDLLLAADTTAGRPDRAAVRGALRRFAGWQRLVHATAVVNLKDGGLTTIQLDHGTISAVGATSLTIAEAGGASVTVTLSGETRVRRDGAKAAIADLKPADEVFVMSKVESGGAAAYLVVVPRR